MAGSIMVRQAAAKTSRQNRYPRHPFTLKQRPWQIQPFMIAPVLPGETMKNLLVQARIVSDPVKHPLLGWWAEQYFFYVKHRDLAIREELTAMMLSLEATAGNVAAANVKHYHNGGTIDWVAQCTDRIIEEYFRNEGEDVDIATIDGMRLASATDNKSSWLDSVINDADMVPIDDVDVDADADGTITAREVDEAMRAWRFQVEHKLTEMTYEDFLRTYGVSTARVEQHRPELLRYLRDWTYPSNTINPEDGTPSSALSWSVADRADKDRFFNEPGFIVGLQIVRPKVYLSGQTGNASQLLTDALAWLPAIMADDPATSIRHVPAGTGPLPGNTDANGYWVDVKDLLLYGDQFANFDLSTAATDTGGVVALPTAGLQKRYANATDADALFAGAANTIRTDGVVSLTIAGKVIETS